MGISAKISVFILILTRLADNRTKYYSLGLLKFDSKMLEVTSNQYSLKKRKKISIKINVGDKFHVLI